MGWDIGAGVVALLAVLAVMVVAGWRSRPQRQVRDGGDPARIWTSADTGRSRANADDPGKTIDSDGAGGDGGVGSDGGGRGGD